MRQLGNPPTKVQLFNHQWRNWLSRLWHVPDWNDVTLTNSWANVGGNYYDASYYKDQWNRVYLRGRIDSGTSGNACFTLPEGYRPNATMDFITDGNTGGAPVIVSVVITSAGVVTATLTGANPEVSFDGIIFIAEA